MSFLQQLVEDPTKIFDTARVENSFKGLVKELGDSIVNYSKLDEIYVEGLDSSQIYGQVKIVIENVGESVMEEMAGGEGDSEAEGSDLEDGVSDEELSELEEGQGQGQEEEIEEDSELEDSEIEEEIEDDDDDESGIEEQRKQITKPTNPTSIKEQTEIQKQLNDDFFDIDQFNKQILEMEEEYADEVVDFNKEVSDDEVDYFQDFFDGPLSKNQLLEEDVSEEEEELEEDLEQEGLKDEEFNLAIGEMKEDLYEKSTFEKQQEQLQKEINQLENELVAEKKWMMKGEVNKSQRPQDSLITEENNFDFDRVSKPVPIITEEITETIEDLIRRRISKDEFDDLPKRFLNEIVKPQRTRTEVSETKSAKSLAEIYEDNYKGVETNETQEKLDGDHQEIIELMGKLTYKLDSLTSFNFVPKPNETKLIEVKNSTISMEDAQPEFVGDSARLAPQEIFKPSKTEGEISLKSGLSYTRDELSTDDKQRLRRANKRKKAKQFKTRPPKKSKTDSVIDTLTGNKNLTIIGKHGEKTDVKGNVKKQRKVDSTNLKL